MVTPDIASLARILLFAVCGLWPRIFQRIPHPIHLNTDGVSRLLWFTRLYDSAKGCNSATEREEGADGWVAGGWRPLPGAAAAGGWRLAGTGAGVCGLGDGF